MRSLGWMIHEIPITPQSLDRWSAYAAPELLLEARRIFESTQRRLEGRVLWTVSSTAVGGGVAELLHALIGYARGAGIDTRWCVIYGPPAFFKLTKRLHNALHDGMEGPGWLTEEDQRLYEETLFANAQELASRIRPRDIVFLHDPQTAGLVPHLARLGARVVWRCHIGHDRRTDNVRTAWAFLLRYLQEATAFVFSREAYLPPELANRTVAFIPPSIDPFMPKNQELSEANVLAILEQVGLLAATPFAGPANFLRSDGTPGRVDRSADIVRLGPPTPVHIPMIVQVSRWDRLKDPLGVMRGFATSHELIGRACGELVLAGPTVNSVADDPEGATVFNEVLSAWRALPHYQRRRVILANLPMADPEENAAIVNALQRHATIVVQKSLHEGFGLTVSEAMWKGRAVIASAVGGIQDQIEDGVSGLLLRDPHDLDAFGAVLRLLLDDAPLRERLGKEARERVRTHFLGLSSLMKHARLIDRVDT